MRILFVCGFNPTMRAWSGLYDPIRTHLDARGDDVEFLTYTWTECIRAVYARMCAALERGGYDAVVAHSMGGALVARYLTTGRAHAPPRVVLCMPLLVPASSLLAALARVPLVGLVPVPKWLGLPSCALRDEPAPRALLNDLTTFFGGQQVKHVYRSWLGPGLASVLERDDVCVLYAARETVAQLDRATLARAAHAYRVDGMHEDFGAPFLSALDDALLSDHHQRRVVGAPVRGVERDERTDVLGVPSPDVSRRRYVRHIEGARHNDANGASAEDDEPRHDGGDPAFGEPQPRSPVPLEDLAEREGDANRVSVAQREPATVHGGPGAHERADRARGGGRGRPGALDEEQVDQRPDGGEQKTG